MIEILLLDDDQDLLEITFEQLMLHFKNIHITKAKSGNEGIDLLMSGHKFDVIISDYNMFHGSGIDLLKFKTSLGYPGYFLFYTSQLTPEVPEILISQEFLGIIEKLKFEELFDKISKALKEKIGFH